MRFTGLQAILIFIVAYLGAVATLLLLPYLFPSLDTSDDAIFVPLFYAVFFLLPILVFYSTDVRWLRMTARVVFYVMVVLFACIYLFYLYEVRKFDHLTFSFFGGLKEAAANMWLMMILPLMLITGRTM